MRDVTLQMDSVSKKATRVNILKYALIISEQIEISGRTRDEIMFLIDIVLSKTQFQQIRPELICVTCILFILKLEDDINAKVKGFFKFVVNQLKISFKDIKQLEAFIISIIPDYFVFIPSMKSVIEVLSKIINANNDTVHKNNQIEAYCLQKYINSVNDLTYSNIIIDSIISISTDQESIHKTYDLLRAVFVSNEIEIL